MPATEKMLAQPADINLAMQFLTRLPAWNTSNMSRSLADTVWAWPLIGAGLGGLAGIIGLIATAFGASPAIAAGVILASLMMMTGALHEDGLADMFDGLWGGQNKQRRLEIMKDSRVGSYGVLALCLATLVRWSALAALLQSGWVIAPLMAAGAISRAPMAVLLATLPNARSGGLSDQAGQPRAPAIWLMVAITTGLGLFLIGWTFIPVFFWVSVVTIAVAGIAKAKIGGQTGDILGASQQCAEIAILACLLAGLAAETG